jgi:hypothetical protein
MRGYRVEGGIVTIGAGETVGMTAAQYKRRAHNVDVIKTDKESGAVVGKGKVPLQFKAGEEIALKDLPKKLVDRLVPLDKPKSDAEKIAFAKAEDRRESRSLADKIKDKLAAAGEPKTPQLV